MSTWLLSGYYPVSGSHFLVTDIRWTTIWYYPVSGGLLSGIWENGIRHIPNTGIQGKPID